MTTQKQKNERISFVIRLFWNKVIVSGTFSHEEAKEHEFYSFVRRTEFFDMIGDKKTFHIDQRNGWHDESHSDFGECQKFCESILQFNF